MVLLSVAVAVLTVLVLIDLVLSAAIIRRLRDTEKQLVDMNTPPDTGMAPGEMMPAFTTAEVSREGLAGRRALVAFFSAGCRHCPDQAQRLADRADRIADQGVSVLSVLGVSEGETDDLAPPLRKAGPLVVENGFGELATRFRVTSTPTFLWFDEAGVLIANGHALEEVMGS